MATAPVYEAPCRNAQRDLRVRKNGRETPDCCAPGVVQSSTGRLVSCETACELFRIFQKARTSTQCGSDTASHVGITDNGRRPVALRHNCVVR